MSPPLPGGNEAERLAELDRYAILSTPPEEAFDRTTKLAARLFGCPIALLSFVTIDRQWFKSCRGFTAVETPRDGSFCSWAIQSDRVMVVPDATEDPRFVAHPLVTAKDGIRFYAGAPLLSPRGFAIGTLCVIDIAPRPEGLSADEISTLEDLAKIVIGDLETRLAVQQAEEIKNVLHTTLSSIGDGVISTDAQGRVIFMNPVAEELTGWTQEEARHRHIEQVFVIVNETTHLPVENPAIRAIAGGQAVGLENHTLLLAKDGRELPIDDSGAPIHRGGAIVGGVLIFRDVMKRRLAERALEYSENQFRRTFANAPLGLVLTHLDGRFIESNEAYRSLTGYTEEELHEISFLSLTHPTEVEYNRTLFQQLVREEIPSYVIDKRILNKAGSMRWVRARATLLRDANGKSDKVIGLVEDVSERKLAEQRFRFLAESIPQMVWTATPDGLLDYVNGQGAQYFDTSQESLLGEGWLAFVHPEDQASAVKSWTGSLQSGSAYETEFRLRRGEDFTWRLHLVRAQPLIGEGGNPTQWFGTCTDIEDKHQAARQIEDDRRRWRELLFQTPSAIAVLRGPEHVLDWVNPGYEQLVGRSSKALAGMPVLEALPEVASQIYSDLLDKVFQNGEPLHGSESFARLGPPNALRELYLNFVYLPTRNAAGVIDGVFAHINDVTEMVAARKIIEESEAQFRTLAETIPHLTWMADETGSIFWYNQRWYEYTGTALEDMQGWGWRSVHDPSVLPEVMTNWLKAIASGQRFEMIFPLKGADGVFHPFLTRVEPIRDGQGNVVRWFGTNTDISDQQRTEEELRRINRDLEEFSYVASHDLQEPLRMVNIFTELLLREKDEQRCRTFADSIAEGVKRMNILIQDLLTFARNVHAEELVVGRADLSMAFQEALTALKIPIEENQPVIVASDLPVTKGDTQQMSHVFQNVLSNALKYRNPSIAPEIHVAAKRENESWVISIRDNGIGFEPEYAERIFGLFKRLHTKEYAGTGLGLAICKRIVERYGGRMWAESVPGQGSTFYFALPDEPVEVDGQSQADA